MTYFPPTIPKPQPTAELRSHIDIALNVLNYAAPSYEDQCRARQALHAAKNLLAPTPAPKIEVTTDEIDFSARKLVSAVNLRDAGGVDRVKSIAMQFDCVLCDADVLDWTDLHDTQMLIEMAQARVAELDALIVGVEVLGQTADTMRLKVPSRSEAGLKHTVEINVVTGSCACSCKGYQFCIVQRAMKENARPNVKNPRHCCHHIRQACGLVSVSKAVAA